jgi:hypothetical protein
MRTDLLKFRAFHPKHGWAHNIRLDVNGLCEVQWNGGMVADSSASGLKEWTVEQFTGCYDKNTTLVFEGDIIQADGENWLIESRDDFVDLCQGDESEVKVVANIHDNPKRLKYNRV